jgi:hypothetical protein
VHEVEAGLCRPIGEPFILALLSRTRSTGPRVLLARALRPI